MFSFLSPLEIDAVFESREYRLGDTVEIDVSLKARSAVEVAQGRIELVCRERFHEVHTVMVPASRPVVPVRFGGPQPPQIRIPKRVTEEFKNISVHSQAVFLQGLSLAKGTLETFQVRLSIAEEMPPYADRGGIMRWRLATIVEQASGMSVSKEKRINVTW